MIKRNFFKIGLVTLLCISSGQAFAADGCTMEITSSDAMQFSKTSMKVPKGCAQVTIKLSHTGSLPRAAMGHNWVLTKADDMAAVAAEGIGAGIDSQYVKPDDARVIAHTKVVGGGESDSVTFETSKLAAGESYMFFCSFPGHSTIMKGTLTLG